MTPVQVAQDGAVYPAPREGIRGSGVVIQLGAVVNLSRTGIPAEFITELDAEVYDVVVAGDVEAPFFGHGFDAPEETGQGSSDGCGGVGVATQVRQL